MKGFLPRAWRLCVVLTICLPVVACNGGGGSGGSSVSAGSGSSNSATSASSSGGGGVVAPGAPGGSSGGGSSGGGGHGPKASGSPLHIPPFGQYGLPIDDATPEHVSVWPDLVQQFVDECKGTLCVTLTREYSGSGEPCGYVGMRPAERAVFHRGDTVVVIGGANCPSASGPDGETTPGGTETTPGIGDPTPEGTDTTPDTGVTTPGNEG